MRAPSSEGEAIWHDSPSVKFNYKATSKHSARVCYRLQEGESKQARGVYEGGGQRLLNLPEAAADTCPRRGHREVPHRCGQQGSAEDGTFKQL